jgi:small subunit ribosomal protein S6
VHDYELMVILDPETEERTVAPSLEAFLEVIRKDGGTIENLEIWGKRRLAYEIKKKSEGIYAVVNFTASPEATAELDRQLRLSEAVMRTKVLRQDEASVRLGAPEAAPVAQKVSLSGGSKRRKAE